MIHFFFISSLWTAWPRRNVAQLQLLLDVFLFFKTSVVIQGLLAVVTAHSWDFSYGCALLLSCPLSQLAFPPLSGHWTPPETGNHIKAHFLSWWHSLLWMLGTVRICDLCALVCPCLPWFLGNAVLQWRRWRCWHLLYVFLKKHSRWNWGYTGRRISAICVWRGNLVSACLQHFFEH